MLMVCWGDAMCCGVNWEMMRRWGYGEKFSDIIRSNIDLDDFDVVDYCGYRRGIDVFLDLVSDLTPISNIQSLWIFGDRTHVFIERMVT